MGRIIRLSIEWPVAVMAMILLTVVFGVVALQTIPIQMSPDIEKPVLDVRAGAARHLLMLIVKSSAVWNVNWQH